MAKLNSLEKLFVEELQDIYDAEHQITEALPKMVKKASASDLQRAFQDHLAVTKKQIDRLDRIFQHLDVSSQRKTCVGMQGLLKEGEEIMKKDADPAVMDAALIGAAQRVEHYEIAAYGTLRAYAQQIDGDQIVDLLEKTLEEERLTDEKLTGIAEGHVNRMAER